MVTFKRLKEVMKPAAYKQLLNWLNGQTISVNSLGETFCYDNDLLDWLEGKGVTD